MRILYNHYLTSGGDLVKRFWVFLRQVATHFLHVYLFGIQEISEYGQILYTFMIKIYNNNWIYENLGPCNYDLWIKGVFLTHLRDFCRKKWLPDMQLTTSSEVMLQDQQYTGKGECQNQNQSEHIVSNNVFPHKEPRAVYIALRETKLPTQMQNHNMIGKWILFLYTLECLQHIKI